MRDLLRLSYERRLPPLRSGGERLLDQLSDLGERERDRERRFPCVPRLSLGPGDCERRGEIGERVLDRPRSGRRAGGEGLLRRYAMADGILSADGDFLKFGGLRDGERERAGDDDALMRFDGGDHLLGSSLDLGRSPPRRGGGDRDRELSRLAGRFPRGPVGAFGGGTIGRREGGGGIGASRGAGRPLPPPLAASSARRLKRSFSFHSA